MSAGVGDSSPQASAGLSGIAEADEALFKTDSFRMEAMKVLPCSKRFVHDWTECPFAHPQEKARRRDPRVHNYTGIACPSMKKEGCCAFGDHCPYAHNVFEYWLHPTRYRTQLCNDGSNCKRKICFFAHSLDELRVPACKPFVSPEALASAAAAAAADAEAKRKAATVGSPLSAFAAVSPGPSPQRASLDALRAAQAGRDVRLSMESAVAGPTSPSTADEAIGSSPADLAVHQALQQLTGAGFSSKDQQVIELVTSLLAQDRVSPEQAASILQQMLPPDALSTLQARLNTPRSVEGGHVPFSDPLGYRSGGVAASPTLRSSFDASFPEAQQLSGHLPRQTAAAALLGAGSPVAAPPPPSSQTVGYEHMAAMQAAAQNMGYHAYSGGAGIAQFQAGGPPMGVDHRVSFESARSSFDTAARMSFERGSMELGTPRASLDAAYPPGLPSYNSLPGQFFSGQLSPVPEQFPMINAPPPTASWSAAGGRYSLDSASAADRLSQDLSRMSFDAATGGRAAPQMANPFASSFFAPSAAAAPHPIERLSAPPAPGGRPLTLPPLPALRTGKSPDPQDKDAVEQQLLGGTALQRLQ